MGFAEDRQKEIEDHFIRSWHGMEYFFRSHVARSGGGHLKAMLTLIHLLRARGYDRQLRAGQSMVTLVLMRSTMNGVFLHQPRLAFSILLSGGVQVHFRGQNINVELTADRVEITPAVENLFTPLLVYPVDEG